MWFYWQKFIKEWVTESFWNKHRGRLNKFIPMVSVLDAPSAPWSSWQRLYCGRWWRWRGWLMSIVYMYISIAMFLVTSPIVINVPTRGLLAVETMHAIVQWLANLNIKRNMMSMFVNKKHRYVLKQWIALNACADWLVKLQISCAIYLRATWEKMASWFVSVTSEEIIQNNFSWCILSHCFSIY